MKKQIRKMNLYFDGETDPSPVWSYATLIGYIFNKKHKFYTWGYGNYSTTTSKQITILCEMFRLERVDITEEDFNKWYFHHK